MERSIKKMEFEFSTQPVTLWPWEYHYYEPPGACNHTDMYYCHPQNRCESCQSRALKSTWTTPVSVSSVNKYSAQEQSKQPQNHFFNIAKPIIKPAHVFETCPASNEIQICKSSKCRVYESTTKTCFICSDHTDKLLALISWVQVESLTKSVPDYDVMSPSPSPSPSYCCSGGSLSSTDGLNEDKGASVFYDRSLPGPGPGPGAWHSESCGESGLDSEHYNFPQSEETETASKTNWKSYFQSRTFSQQDGDYLETENIQAERIQSKKSRSVGQKKVHSRSRSQANLNPVMRCASAASVSAPGGLITTMGTQNLFCSYSASKGCDTIDFKPTSLKMSHQDTSQANAILISSSPLSDQKQEYDGHTLNEPDADPDADADPLREQSCFDKSLVTDSDNRQTLDPKELEQVAPIISQKAKSTSGFLQTALEQCDDENEVQLFNEISSEVRQCSSDVDLGINDFHEVPSTIQQIQIQIQQATEVTQGPVVGPGLESSMILASVEESPTSTSQQSSKKMKRKKLEKQKRLDAILVDKESTLNEKRRVDDVIETEAEAEAEIGGRGPTILKSETLAKTKNNPVQTKNQTESRPTPTVARACSVNQLCGSKPKLQIKERNSNRSSSYAAHCPQSSYISKIKELNADTRTPQLVRLQALQSCRSNLRFPATSSLMPDEDSSDESQSNEDMESSKKHCQYQNVSQVFATRLQFTTTDAELNVGNNNFRTKKKTQFGICREKYLICDYESEKKKVRRVKRKVYAFKDSEDSHSSQDVVGTAAARHVGIQTNPKI